MKNLIYFISLSLFIAGCKSKNIENQEHANELFKKAIEYNLQENNSAALLLYDSAIALAPNVADYYTNRGYTKQQLNDQVGALNDYYKSLELDSMDVTAYGNIGVIFHQRGEYEKSLEYAQKALALGDISIYYNIGVSLFLLKRYEPAIDAFLNLLEKYPASKTRELVFYYLGNSYANLGQKESAQSCWDKANELAGYDIVTEFDSQPENPFLSH